MIPGHSGSVTAFVLFVSASLASSEPCSTDQFKCADGSCVLKSRLCNGVADCKDGTDENDCYKIKCEPPSWFHCGSGECMSYGVYCNGQMDCSDGSDEPRSCSPDSGHFKINREETCSTDEFTCANRQCIKSTWMCDGKPDCLDGSDETSGCGDKFECLDGFLCKNKHCVMQEFHCDGVDDCGDNSDEESCSTIFHSPDNCPVDQGYFLCEDKIACIEERNVCDNFSHCFDGSDEAECNVNQVLNDSYCRSIGCAHSCHLAPHGLVNCTCPKGYRVEADGKSCGDVDECEEFGICYQRCKNLNGSYECSCDDGYSLQPDNHTCKASGGEALLLFTSLNRVRGVYLPSEVYFTVARNVSHAVGVSHSGHHVYWTDTSHGEAHIMRSMESGHEREILVDSGLGTPEDLAVDYVTNNIYFTDRWKKYIGVCTENGLSCAVLNNEDIHKPRAIALYPKKGLMYWTDWGNVAMIATSGMDGSNPRPLVFKNLKWPNGLALDVSNDRLYWVDAKTHTIETVRLDGNGRKVVLSKAVKHPFSLAIFEDTLYWSDWDSQEIQKCNKFTGKNHTWVLKERNNKNIIYGVHIYHSALNPYVENPCVNNRCSHLCLLSPKGSYTCACPEHSALGSDKHTCRVRSKPFQVAVGGDRKIMLLSPLHLGRQSATEINLPDISSVGCMAYDTVSDSIIISDPFQRKLYHLNLHTKEVFVMVRSGLGHVSSMSFDSYGNNLYLTDLELKRVDVWSMSTKSMATVYRLYNGDIPESIVVVPEYGVFFLAVTHPDGTVCILRANMDGTVVIPHLNAEKIHGPKISLAYDKGTKKVYWSDSGEGTLGSMNIDGTGQEVVHVAEGTPISITAQSKYIFWVERGSSNLFTYDTSVTATDLSDLPEFVTRLAMDKEDYLSVVLVGESESTNFHPCYGAENRCSHVCLVSFGKTRICHCPIGMHLGSDNRTCHLPANCSDSQFKCRTDDLCIAKIQRCDGHADCPSGDDEKDCVMDNCTASQFKCTNGQCIAAERRCDNEYDCSDHSDERSCASNCTDGNFQCGSGECLPANWRCDLMGDCKDFSDEHGCSDMTCQPSFFKCKSGTCIPKTWECDMDRDCIDGSDEHEKCAPPTCKPDEMRCGNGLCISKSMECDGANDCGDETDESSCEQQEGAPVCGSDKFICSLSKGMCVPQSSRCNGTAECPRGEDEMDCSNCMAEEFQCKNMKCIYNRWVCDAEDDCGDHSDEDPRLCSHLIQSQGSPATQCLDFRCRTGECIPLYLACNGNKNCQDGSDEGPNCGTSCKDNHCQQMCSQTPTVGRCSCKDGYRLNSDGYTCSDVDECAEQRCSQLCVNTPGSFNCSCLPGYLLKSDRLTCKAMGEPMSYILSSDDEIRKVSHDFRNLDLVSYNPGSQISGIDLDTTKKLLYWSTGTNHRINVMSLNGTEKSFVFGSGQPGKLCLDWITENIYYIDHTHFGSVKVCHMGEKKYADVVHVDEGFIISDLFFNPISGILYYSKVRPSTLMKPSSQIMKLSSSDRNSTVLVPGNISWVSGFAFDHVRQYLYWCDLYNQVIEKVRHDGNERQIVFRADVHRPESLTFFEDSLYWLTKGSGTIKKCKVYGGLKGNCETIPLYFYDIRFLVIMQEARQPKVKNPCVGKCDPYSLCVITAEGPKCICEDGTALSDGETCDVSHMTLSNEVVAKYAEGTSRQYLSHERPPTSGNSTAVIGILMTALIICSAFATYLCVRKRRSRVVLETMHFQNPSFGLSHVQSSYHPSELTPGEHHYENATEKIVKHPDGKYGVITREKEKDTKGGCRLDLHDYESDSDVEDRMDLKAKLLP